MASSNNGVTNQVEVAGGHNEELYPDILAQFPILDAYTHLAFGFELPVDADRDAIASALEQTYDRLSEQIPMLGWQVAEKSGVRTAVPWPDGAARERVRVKNCDDSILSMPQLLSMEAPISELHGDVLAPWPGFPMPRGLASPQPVTALQVNFVKGGLILILSNHHTVMDASSNFYLMKLFATVLSGGEVDEADLEQANRDRSRVVPLIPRNEPVKNHTYLRRPAGYQLVFPSTPPTWCYFKIPVASLAKLAKTQASELVSEDDVLLAFYWQRLCAVRLAQGVPPDTVSKVARAIDARRALGIPSTYLGSMICMAITRLQMGQVVSLTLHQLAQVLRREMSQSNKAWAIRSCATLIAREPDRSGLLYNGTHNSNTDIGATSSLNTSQTLPPPCGPLLGPCRFSRRVLGPPIPGSLVVQEPVKGAIYVLVCLPKHDLEALKEEDLWQRYAKSIG